MKDGVYSPLCWEFYPVGLRAHGFQYWEGFPILVIQFLARMSCFDVLGGYHDLIFYLELLTHTLLVVILSLGLYDFIVVLTQDFSQDLNHSYSFYCSWGVSLLVFIRN